MRTEIHLATMREIRIDEPGIDVEQLGELIRHAVVSGEMLRLAPRGPACLQRRQNVLLQILQDVRNARGKVLVGGLDGFTEFDPDSVVPNSRPPVIVVTGFSVFDREISAARRSSMVT